MTKTRVIINKENVEKLETGSIWPQILAILAGSLAAFTNGVIFAWTSPFLLKIIEDDSYDISEREASNITIIQPVTMIFSTLIFSKLPDLIGRKKTLLIICLPQTLCLITSALARDIYIFYLARVFAGIGNAFLWTAMPMYIGEIATPNIRGVFGNAITFLVNVGQFAVNVVGSYCGIATTSYIFMVIPVLFLISFSLMPESPYFYLIKKDDAAAKKSLRFLRGKENVESEFNQIKSDVERQMSESGTWKDLFVIESNRKALVAASFLRISQQFSGGTIFIQYSQYIFQKSGGNVSPQVGSIILSGLSVFLNILVLLFIVHRFSRKILYTTSLAMSTIILWVICGYFFVDEILPEVDMSLLNWLPVTAMVSFQVFSSFGLQIIPSLMLGELFSASIKSKAMTALLIVMAVSMVVTNAIFNMLIAFIGSYAPFMFFGICTIFMTIFSFSLVPETKGKTLEQIQMALKRKSFQK